MLLDTPVCDFGWKAPDFTLSDPKGRKVSLEDGLRGRALVIVFLCNHCPYVQAIAGRLAEDSALLMREEVNVIGIMSNDYREYPADSPAEMRSFARNAGWEFPYLVDEDQSVGKAYGAVCTPDFFGFDSGGGLQYRGRLDDAGKDGDIAGRRRELVEAMRMVAETGSGPAEQTPSMGCSIKWT